MSAATMALLNSKWIKANTSQPWQHVSIKRKHTTGFTPNTSPKHSFILGCLPRWSRQYITFSLILKYHYPSMAGSAPLSVNVEVYARVITLTPAFQLDIRAFPTYAPCDSKHPRHWTEPPTKYNEYQTTANGEAPTGGPSDPVEYQITSIRRRSTHLFPGHQ